MHRVGGRGTEYRHLGRTTKRATVSAGKQVTDLTRGLKRLPKARPMQLLLQRLRGGGVKRVEVELAPQLPAGAEAIAVLERELIENQS